MGIYLRVNGASEKASISINGALTGLNGPEYESGYRKSRTTVTVVIWAVIGEWSISPHYAITEKRRGL